MSLNTRKIRCFLSVAVLLFIVSIDNAAYAACFYDSNNMWVEEYKRSFGTGNPYDRKILYIKKQGSQYSSAPSGVTKGTLVGSRRTGVTEHCIGEGGEFCTVMTSFHEDKYQVCYAVLEITGYSYNKNTRTGTSTLKTESGSSVSSVKYDLLSGSTVVYTTNGSITGSGANYTSSFNLSGATAGSYTLRITAKDNKGEIKTETRSIVIEPIYFSNYSYDFDAGIAAIAITDVGKNPQGVTANIIDLGGNLAATVNGIQISADNESFRYEFDYRVVATGNYSISIVATDTWGEDFVYNGALHDGQSAVHIDAVEILDFQYDPKKGKVALPLVIFGKIRKLHLLNFVIQMAT